MSTAKNARPAAAAAPAVAKTSSSHEPTPMDISAPAKPKGFPPKKAAGASSKSKGKKVSRVERRKGHKLELVSYISQLAGRIRVTDPSKPDSDPIKPKWRPEALIAVNDWIEYVATDINEACVKSMKGSGLKKIDDVKMCASVRTVMALASPEEEGLRYQALKAGSTAVNTWLNTQRVRKGEAQADADADEALEPEGEEDEEEDPTVEHADIEDDEETPVGRGSLKVKGAGEEEDEEEQEDEEEEGAAEDEATSVAADDDNASQAGGEGAEEEEDAS